MQPLRRLCVILSALSLAGSATAQTNLLLNGDFSAGNNVYIANNTVVDNWDYYDDPLPDSIHYAVFEFGNIRLNEGGGASDGVSQSFTATTGLTYTASVDANLLFGSAPLSLRIEVQTDDGLSTVTFLTSSITSASLTTYSFDFVAPQSALRFVIRDVTPSVEPGNNGTDLFVDNASITLAAVPEPSTYAAILGAGALGLAMLRRRRQSAAT